MHTRGFRKLPKLENDTIADMDKSGRTTPLIHRIVCTIKYTKYPTLNIASIGKIETGTGDDSYRRICLRRRRRPIWTLSYLIWPILGTPSVRVRINISNEVAKGEGLGSYLNSPVGFVLGYYADRSASR